MKNLTKKISIFVIAFLAFNALIPHVYAGEKSNKCDITEIEFSDVVLDQTFSSSTTEYTGKTTNSSVEKIMINKLKVSKKAKKDIDTGMPITLEPEETTIEITVTAQDEKTTKTYKFVIRKDIVDIPTEEELGNCNLKSLSVSHSRLYPGFSPEETSYTAIVNYSVSSVRVRAARETTKSRVTLPGNNGVVNLNVGDNTITVKVTSDDGHSKDYTITVRRRSEEETDTDLDGIPIYKLDTDNYNVYEVKCSDWSLAHKIWNTIRILGPFLYMIFASLDFFKIVISGGEEDIKKAKKLIPKRLIIFLLFIIVPFIVSLIVSNLGAGNAGNLDLFKCIVNGE